MLSVLNQFPNNRCRNLACSKGQRLGAELAAVGYKPSVLVRKRKLYILDGFWKPFRDELGNKMLSVNLLKLASMDMGMLAALQSGYFSVL